LRPNYKLTCAIAAILGSAQAHPALAADPTTAQSVTGTLGEVLVTAQRRKQSIQDVPITVQAVTGQQLEQMKVANMDDLLKLTPNVTVSENGPGQGQVYIRGLAADMGGGQSSATINPFPNVALYLDDQSMQFPGRNADVYIVDLERIEVLEGPQGTLFGGGAEGGAIRYITNKPVLDRTTGSAEATYGITAHGDPNTSVHGVLNLPLLQGKLAARLVIYNDRRGGYIDNVPSSFTRKNTDLGNFYAGIAASCSGGAAPVNGSCPTGSSATSYAPPPGPATNNYAIARNASNPLQYNGARVALLAKINEDWNFLITQSYQNMEAQGDFTQYPVGSDGQQLGAWQNTVFVPAYDKDRFENTAWTLNGGIGALSLIYSGSFLDRHIDNQDDYTNYARSAGGFYYQCTGGPTSTGVLGGGTPPVCYSPVSSWRDQVRNTHQSHEIRLSTPDDWRLRGIAGAYYEDFRIDDVMNFNYKTIPSCTAANLAAARAGGAPCLANVSTLPNTTATDPGQRLDNTAFGEDAQRGYKQLAFFGTVDYDVLPKVLTVSAGTRFYHYTEYETGSEYYTSGDCLNIPNGDCDVTTPDGINIDAEHLRKGYHGFRSSANLTWHLNPHVMLYYTYSQGFRPGGFNRGSGHVAKDVNGNWQFAKPVNYSPDTLINNEVGWKGEFLDHRLQLNGSLYDMTWKNVQLIFFDPTQLGNTAFATNGPDYTIKGFELQFAARIVGGLTVEGSGSYNRARQTSSPCLIANNPALANYGQCITEVKGRPFSNPFGGLDSVPAFSPKLQYNLRLRYDWVVGDYDAYATVGGNYVGSMWNQPSTYPGATDARCNPLPTTTRCRYLQPAYHTIFASTGVSKDNWHVEVYGTNLGDSDASVFTSTAQFIKTEVPLRPRVIGLTFGYDF